MPIGGLECQHLRKSAGYGFEEDCGNAFCDMREFVAQAVVQDSFSVLQVDCVYRRAMCATETTTAVTTPTKPTANMVK